MGYECIRNEYLEKNNKQRRALLLKAAGPAAKLHKHRPEDYEYPHWGCAIACVCLLSQHDYCWC